MATIDVRTAAGATPGQARDSTRWLPWALLAAILAAEAAWVAALVALALRLF